MIEFILICIMYATCFNLQLILHKNDKNEKTLSFKTSFFKVYM